MRAAIVVLAAVAAFGQSRQERARQVIDAAVQALGGPQFMAMENRVESGRAYSFFREELSGLSVATIYVRYRKPSNPPVAGEVLVDERESFGKDEKFGAVLFMGDKGFEITFRGARPLPQERLDRYKDTVLHEIFYILRERMQEPGLIFESKGTQVMDNYPVDAVDITDADNRTVTVYFHQSTHLPVRQVYYWRNPKTGDRNEEVTIFGKYKDIGGVQWPLDVQRLRNGDRLFQLYADSAQVNQKLDDKKFELPAGMKILKPLK
jgi:hypothetical protein